MAAGARVPTQDGPGMGTLHGSLLLDRREGNHIAMGKKGLKSTPNPSLSSPEPGICRHYPSILWVSPGELGGGGKDLLLLQPWGTGALLLALSQGLVLSPPLPYVPMAMPTTAAPSLCSIPSAVSVIPQPLCRGSSRATTSPAVCLSFPSLLSPKLIPVSPSGSQLDSCHAGAVLEYRRRLRLLLTSKEAQSSISKESLCPSFHQEKAVGATG